jgi:alanyl-tRNA synthetase
MLRTQPKRLTGGKPTTSNKTTQKPQQHTKKTLKKTTTTQQRTLSSTPQTSPIILTDTADFHTPERFEYPSGTPQSTNELRESFTSYFKSQGHEHLPSSSVVPISDPSLLFTSAGMVPFKNVFLGIEQPPNGNTRITTAQRCIRAGGKHNDLDNVGYTARHHTFFEMLGNFSFGDYFKEEAIFFAWEYLTTVLQMPKKKLMVSVFETDDEAAKLWSKISGFSESNGSIRRMGAEDNFWQMGDTGPCGPCSEIYFDQGFEVDGEQFLEIWNLVFMQYNRFEDGSMVQLDKKCVDTGMGLERLAAVMQGVRNNFDNDTFLNLVNKVGSTAKFHNNFDQIVDSHNAPLSSTRSKKILTSNGEEISSNTPPSTNLDLSTPITHSQRVTATRVITDHLRAILAMLYDGVQPGSTGRGYVLRRILRRACRYGLNLGYSSPFMYQHIEDVLASMEPSIPGISRHAKQLRADLFREEKIFSASLNKGMKIIKDFIGKDLAQNPILVKNAHNTDLDGNRIFPVDLAFSLYDAHGFPIDLTELCVKDFGYSLDTNAVEELLQKRKIESRESSKAQLASLNNNSNKDEILTQKIIDSMFDLWRGEGFVSEFVGYEKTFVESTRVLDIHPLGVMKRNDSPDNMHNFGKRKVMFSLESCPFYPTGGGQTSDTGHVTLRIPTPRLPEEFQSLSQSDFQSVNINISNAIRDNSGQMILLVAEMDEHPFLTSDLILSMLKEESAFGAAGIAKADQRWNRIFVSASVDSDLRSQTSVHHTATHLLQAALQKVLGQAVNEVGDHNEQHHHDHNDDGIAGDGASIKQAGSQVEHKNLRFDFGFSRPLTAEEINAVEDRINAIALRRIPVNVCEMSFDEARDMGAMALFGEKYGSEVRVVSIPDLLSTPSKLSPIDNVTTDKSTPINTAVMNTRHANRPKNFSVELCGGTHVSNTIDCYPFIIQSENGVSSGTRRIEAMAGIAAAQHLRQQHRLIKVLKSDEILKVHHLAQTDEVIANVIKLKAKSNELSTRVKELEKDKLALLFGGDNNNGGKQSAAQIQNVNPLLATFWHQPNGIKLSVIVPDGDKDDNSRNHIAPAVLLYDVDASLSGDYNMYRKFTQDLFQQQSAKHAQFTTDLAIELDPDGKKSHQSVAHVFIGRENGKALVYSNIPDSMVKNAQNSPFFSAHGGKPLASNDVWKSISNLLPKSKGGGNMALAQGTFDFSEVTITTQGADNILLQSSGTRMEGIGNVLAPILTQSMRQ